MDPQALVGEPSSATAMNVIPEIRHIPAAAAEDHVETPSVRDEYWSPLVFVASFWIFLSGTLLLGVYSPVKMELGPHSSLLITANSLLVDSIKVEQLDAEIPGVALYGFDKDPPLDVTKCWSQNYSIHLEGGLDEEWVLLLNEGSQINVSYSVSPPSSSLVFVIAEGVQEYVRWREEPSHPNNTLAWNIIQGEGTIQQDFYESSTYYFAVGNLNTEEVEVNFNFKVKSLLYNTTEAYYSCMVARGACSLKMFFPNGNAAVLTSAGWQQGTTSDTWYVKLSYGPRWTTYLTGIGLLTIFMFLAVHFLNHCCKRELEDMFQPGEQRSVQAPLLSQKDDDLASWGSSYDSCSQDDDDLEDGLAVSSAGGKPLQDGEYNSNIRRLCAICYDAPRDCFFLPCGHCAACYACGTKIAELAGTCPICRRNFKKVRRIFTV